MALAILIVDDNCDSADTLALLLAGAADDVVTAYTGTEGAAVAEEFRPDVIIVDLGMPHFNGLQFAGHVRARPWGGEVLLVAVTGWSRAGDVARAASAGFDAYFVKPVDYAAIEAMVDGRRRLGPSGAARAGRHPGRHAAAP